VRGATEVWSPPSLPHLDPRGFAGLALILAGTIRAATLTEMSSRDPEFSPGSTRLVVAEVISLEEFRSLESEWRAIASYSGTPFATWDWAFAWWGQLREQKLGVRDTLSIRTVRTRTGELVAVAPMLVSQRPSFGPIRLRQLQFFGADPNVTEQRGLVARPEWQREALLALISHARSNAGGWDCMQLSGIPIDLELGDLASSPDFEWQGETADYLLTVPDSWQVFRAGLPRNIKESLRKCYNSLGRDGLEFSLNVVQDVAAVAPALDRFFALHAARARVSGTVNHSNAFAGAETKAFLRDVCRRFAARGALRIFQLLVAGKVVAVRIGFLVGDALYLYYSGYDPAFAKYSVMTTTVAEAIQYAIAHGIPQVNLSTGNDVSKTRWNPTERKTRQAFVLSPSRRARLTHRLYRQAVLTIQSLPALRQATRFLARRSTPPPAPAAEVHSTVDAAPSRLEPRPEVSEAHTSAVN